MGVWNSLSLLQKLIVGAIVVLMGYWILGAIVRSTWQLAMFGLLLIVAVAVLQVSAPKVFCDLQWPALIAFLCSR